MLTLSLSTSFLRTAFPRVCLLPMSGLPISIILTYCPVSMCVHVYVWVCLCLQVLPLFPKISQIFLAELAVNEAWSWQAVAKSVPGQQTFPLFFDLTLSVPSVCVCMSVMLCVCVVCMCLCVVCVLYLNGKIFVSCGQFSFFSPHLFSPYYCSLCFTFLPNSLLFNKDDHILKNKAP